ncbi:MAG: hypothetical protein UU47_C0031G0004 [candidate division TM6 bacterium GW2011_GWE2_41_16]|nr:MAG: hypothetical protein UU47_C0031G0004 [candidate division TM6 bacterium GW2011_GWE2_41_16]
MQSKSELGRVGEEFVARYLSAQGFTLCAKNYKKRCGEIDLVARKENVVAFVEVKLREHAYFSLSEVITSSKQRKIIKTALYYQYEYLADQEVVLRFDVALLERNGVSYDLVYIPHAYTSDEAY